MKIDFGAAMRQALQLTRAQNLIEATRVIQRALAGRSPPRLRPIEPRERALAPAAPAQVSGTADAAEPAPQPAQAASAARPMRRAAAFGPHATAAGRGPEAPASGRSLGPPSRLAPSPALRKAPPVAVPEGAAYLARTFACAAAFAGLQGLCPERRRRPHGFR